MSQRKDIEKIIDGLRHTGWRVELGKHWKCTHPKGGTITISRTPACPFALKNIQADIKRMNKKHAKEIA